jgi:hypothetical protein
VDVGSGTFPEYCWNVRGFRSPVSNAVSTLSVERNLTESGSLSESLGLEFPCSRYS